MIAPLVDTDVWIDLLRGHPLAVACVRELKGRVFISSVSVAELYVGVREGSERAALDDLISTLDVVDLTPTIAMRGGLIRRDFGRTHGVGLNDALIAASVIEHSLYLLTLNVKHYPGLNRNQLKQAYLKV